MHLLARLALLPLLIAALVACGSDDSKSDDKSDDTTSSSNTAPQESDDSADDGDYPTDASVEDYCAAYKGEDINTKLDQKTSTIGEMLDFMQQGYDKILEVGIPENFTDDEQDAFDEQLDNFENAITTIRQLGIDDMKVIDARNNDKIKAQIGEVLDISTPQALRDYSAKNCK